MTLRATRITRSREHVTRARHVPDWTNAYQPPPHTLRVNVGLALVRAEVMREPIVTTLIAHVLDAGNESAALTHPDHPTVACLLLVVLTHRVAVPIVVGVGLTHCALLTCVEVVSTMCVVHRVCLSRRVQN